MDFIEVYDHAVSARKCQAIIKYFEEHKTDQQRGTVGSKGELNRKKKDTWELPGRKFAMQSFIEMALYQGIVQGTNAYMAKYPAIVGHVAKWDVENGYNLQKYNPKCAYWIPHCEQSSRVSGSRMLVWMIYLNTVTDDGGTYFENYDKTINAVRGRCVIWPAFWTHFHNGIVSKTQTKYIATGWFMYDPIPDSRYKTSRGSLFADLFSNPYNLTQ